MAGHDLSVRLCGVRGSYPVPGQEFSSFGGNTACIEVRAGKHVIIMDAGTGIIELGNRLVPEIKEHAQKSREPFEVTIVFSHTHHDHIQGLPYFAPAYLDECALNIFGTQTFSQSLEQILSGYMGPQYSPVELEELHARLRIQHLSENDALVFPAGSRTPELRKRTEAKHTASGDVVLDLLRNYAHPKIGTYVIRTAVAGKSVVYATDTEGYVGGDRRLTEFARNTNLLIHDAQYDVEQYLETQGFGHSTYKMAAEVANAAKVENLVLFHHDPYHDDHKLREMEHAAQELFPDTTAGSEGQTFEF